MEARFTFPIYALEFAGRACTVTGQNGELATILFDTAEDAVNFGPRQPERNVATLPSAAALKTWLAAASIDAPVTHVVAPRMNEVEVRPDGQQNFTPQVLEISAVLELLVRLTEQEAQANSN